MSALFQFSESNTVLEVVHDGITNLNLGSVDSYNLVTSTNRVISGQNSFAKYIRAKFTGSFTEISNMKFWKSNGDLVTGETIKAAANVTFATPSQTSTGDSNIPTTEGTALSVDSFEGAATIVNGGSGVSGYSDYIRVQAQSTGSTPAGVANTKQYTFEYDEV